MNLDLSVSALYAEPEKSGWMITVAEGLRRVLQLMSSVPYVILCINVHVLIAAQECTLKHLK